jgi:phage terminase large subunit
MRKAKPLAKVNISRKIFNDIYVDEGVLSDKTRILLLVGSAGSGKSLFACQKILFRVISEDEKNKFLILRKVARTIRNSVFSVFVSLIHEWGIQNLFSISKTDFTITCVNGSQIIFSGMDDPEKLKSIHNITGVFCDEMTEFNKSDYLQLLIRLRARTKTYRQLIMACNPSHTEHWIYKEFIETPKENVRVFKTTYKDNRFIDEEYKQVLEGLIDSDYFHYRVYALGEWCALKGAIFTNYEVREISRKDEDYDEIYAGIDFGWNDPSCYIRVGIDRSKKELYILREIYESKITNDDLIRLVSKYHKRKERLILDSAEPARIEDFKRAGFFAAKSARKGKGSIRSGIDKIRQFKIIIHPDCVNLIREISLYKYAEDKEGNLTEQPIDMHNHSIDALRYALESLSAKKKIKAGLSLY